MSGQLTRVLLTVLAYFVFVEFFPIIPRLVSTRYVFLFFFLAQSNDQFLFESITEHYLTIVLVTLYRVPRSTVLFLESMFQDVCNNAETAIVKKSV